MGRLFKQVSPKSINNNNTPTKRHETRVCKNEVPSTDMSQPTRNRSPPDDESPAEDTASATTSRQDTSSNSVPPSGEQPLTPSKAWGRDRAEARSREGPMFSPPYKVRPKLKKCHVATNTLERRTLVHWTCLARQTLVGMLFGSNPACSMSGLVCVRMSTSLHYLYLRS